MRLFSIRLREVQKEKKHRDDDEDKKLKPGNEMIGSGVRVQVLASDNDETNSNDGDSDSETESQYYSGDDESESGDNESDGESDVDSEEGDWWEDMDPSNIFIFNGKIYRIIKGDLKYLKNGDVECNEVVYDESFIVKDDYDDSQMYVECGYVLRRDGSEEDAWYLVNDMLFEQCEKDKNNKEIEKWRDGKFY